MDFCGVFELRWKDTSLLSLSFTSVMQKGFQMVSGFPPRFICTCISVQYVQLLFISVKDYLLSVSLSLYGVMFHRNCHSPPLPFSFLRNLFVLFWLALLSSPRASSWLDLIVIAHAVIMLYYWHSMVNLGKTSPPPIHVVAFLSVFVYTWPSFPFCPVCRIVNCPSPSVSGSKRRPACWRVSSILTLSASMTPGRVPAKERNALFSSLSSWHLAR